ncbi:ribosomal protection-like ABC-F family protein [Cohnella cholangitidis]|uniref:ABC-F family ATP-binding cassette domain-containing protein n=1 Tax=Cohnella cholangitidis TaxID=2598458 RepID=A0A7G5BY33_9BACL|nr:ABC-F family ATP-binding cassette domain-containing protein [Cohnella cholangitidis]QMV41867.1 ABC-F family ATP-binding cassette domain-containing protein [Cohnella cholangitidis]
MLTINCQNVKKYNGAQLILENVTFELRYGEKIGLVGRNGSGKSTLLRMVSKLDTPDAGMLTVRKDARIGYLEQIPAEAADRTVYDVLALSYRELLDCRSEMTVIEGKMSEPEAATQPERLEALLVQYSALQELFEREGGYELDARIEQVANGLGIERDWYAREYRSLSGGEKTKVGLASQLIGKPDLLLLDEPTNHLDLDGVEWLEEFLAKYEGACLIVSHDRYFLDRVVTKILELEDGVSSVYHANYTKYVKEKEVRLLQEFADYQEQQKKLKKMRETIKQLMEWGKVGGNEKFFRRAASMQKALDRIEKLKRPAIDRKEAEFGLQPLDRSGKRVIEFESVSKRFGNSTVLDQVSGSVEYGERVMLIGRNGSGKSTLLKIILGQEKADEGQVELGARVQIGYLAQQQYPDDPKLSVLEFFRQEAGMEEGEARSRLAAYLFYGAEVFKPLSLLSGGEWTRLRLALIVIRKPNLLILDEPTNHMDIASREALEEALEEFPGTIVAITHDRYLVNRLSRTIWELDQGRINLYLGNFDDYKAKSRRKDATEGKLSRETSSPSKKTSFRKKSSRDNEKNSEPGQPMLEKEIAALEQRLIHLEVRLSELAEQQDSMELERKWAEREVILAELDLMYEKWVTEYGD